MSNIIVTTGIYDLIKDQVRRKRVTQAEEDLLNEELRQAKQVLRRELPNDIVTVNRKVVLNNHTTGKEETYIFVDSDKEKKKKGKYSITCNMAMATLGRKVGDVLDWPFKGGNKKIEILSVEAM